MSELLRRAAQLQAEGATHAKRYARQQAEATERQRLAREESVRRAAKFITIMRARNVATTPLYVQESRVDYALITPRYLDQRQRHLGNGWQVRRSAYSYDDGLTPGILVTTENDVYECDNPKARDGREEESCLVWGARIIGRDHSLGEHTLFAGEEGLTLLAQGLVLNGIEEQQ